VCQGIRSKQAREKERDCVKICAYDGSRTYNRKRALHGYLFYAPGSTTHSVAKHKLAELGYISNKRSETIYVIPRGSLSFPISSPSSSSPLSTCAFLRLPPIPLVCFSFAVIACASYADRLPSPPLSLSLSLFLLALLRIRSLSKSRFRERWTNRSLQSGHTTAPWYF